MADPTEDDNTGSDTSQPFAFSPDMQSYANAIKAIESSGDYGIQGPKTRTGDRAHGAYQVMGANVPSWTQEALGTSMSPEEFRADTTAQDKVFNYKFGQLLQKYGNPQDAASAWFTGRPLSSGGSASDVTGTTGNQYVDKFNNFLSGTPMGPAQHFQPMAPGALSMGNLGGSPDMSQLAAMFGNQNQQPTFGQRLANVGAALASISSPSQASVIKSLVPQQNQMSQGDRMIKALQLMQAMKTYNQGNNQMTYKGLAPDGKTPMYINPQGLLVDSSGKQITEAPEAATDNTETMLKHMGDIGKVQDGAQDNAYLNDTVNGLKNDLATNPEIYKNVRWDASAKAFVNNATGNSDGLSQYMKNFNAVLNQAANTAASGAHFGRITNQEMQGFYKQFAPLGAGMDSMTMYDVLNRIGNSAQNHYNTNSALLRSYEKNYKDNYTWDLQGADGKSMNPTDWNNANRDRWTAANQANAASYQQLKNWHDQKTGVKPPQNFFDFTMGN